jgi:OmpA-OmpF porin, OOP family
MPIMPERAIGRLAAMTAMVMCTASCGVMFTSGGSTGAARCSWTSQPPTQPSGVQSDTIVVIDATASFWPQAGKSRELPANLAQVATSELLTGFGGPGTRLVSVGAFDGSSATIDWKLGGVALPVPTGDSQAIQAEKQSIARCLSPFVTSALSATPRASGTDDMAALAAAGQQLGNVPAAGAHVVVITDGLSNTGCLDLNKVISQGQAPSAVVTSCPEHADLAALQGVSLRLYGIGFQAAAPPLTTAEQAWVEGYWQNLCAALKVASPGSCVAPPGSDFTQTSDVSRPADPPIVFPVVHKQDPSIPVPADLLFAFDSATLSAAGQAYLGILVQQIRGQGRTVTKVIGHTDAVGTASYNLELSQRRASAVRAFLAGHGFTGVTAIGVGEAQPACSPQYAPGGAPIESCMAKDRRVQMILGG